MEAAEKRTRSHKRAENCFPGEDRADDDGDDYDDGDSDDDAHRIILFAYTETHHVKGSSQRKGCIPLEIWNRWGAGDFASKALSLMKRFFSNCHISVSGSTGDILRVAQMVMLGGM